MDVDALTRPFLLETENLLNKLKPNRAGDAHRSKVFWYVKKIVLKCHPDAIVCPFGSVPLKTYLPHGDLDLTVFLNKEDDSWLGDVYDRLKNESKNENAQLAVRDVVFVNHERVEVKVVKCIVDDIPVDISTNQFGGLKTLLFLENFDHVLGKHLFKQSLLLIKAWCYFESRIMSSQHGLFATYALETLVLCILNLFHKEISSPLAALLKFLEYFSSFEWDRLCVTVSGPVEISDVLADGYDPEKGFSVGPGRDCLIGSSFLAKFTQAGFGASPTYIENLELDAEELQFADTDSTPRTRQRPSSHGASESSNLADSSDESPTVPSGQAPARTFMAKYLNVVDPLVQYNNLGRSVSKSNSVRIRRALAFGYKKLLGTLLGANGGDRDVAGFFRCTLRALSKRPIPLEPGLLQSPKRKSGGRVNGNVGSASRGPYTRTLTAPSLASEASAILSQKKGARARRRSNSDDDLSSLSPTSNSSMASTADEGAFHVSTLRHRSEETAPIGGGKSTTSSMNSSLSSRDTEVWSRDARQDLPDEDIVSVFPLNLKSGGRMAERGSGSEGEEEEGLLFVSANDEFKTDRHVLIQNISSAWSVIEFLAPRKSLPPPASTPNDPSDKTVYDNGKVFNKRKPYVRGTYSGPARGGGKTGGPWPRGFSSGHRHLGSAPDTKSALEFPSLGSSL